MRRIMLLLLLTYSAIAVVAQNVVVNCDAGQSLNSAISKLNKQVPNTVTVQGTCTEDVTIVGFENLTVKSTTGATLVQPSVFPINSSFFSLLSINSSRSVAIEGLNFNSDSSKPPAIGVGAGSQDVRLRNLSIVGGGTGILVFEHSQVSISGVTVRNAGWAYVAAVDQSQLEVEGCLLQESTGTGWHQGIYAEASHARVWKTTIRDMQAGLHSTVGGEIVIVNGVYYPTGGMTDVIIDNPSGLNQYGALVDSSSTLAISSAKLRILNAGQPWGGASAGITVSGSSSLSANANLIISGSHGQGIYVNDNSYADLDGSSITGSQHGGLVAVNLSTISANTWDKPTPVSGNAVDVFCDSRSLITGAVHIVNTSTVQCPNLLQWDTVQIP